MAAGVPRERVVAALSAAPYCVDPDGWFELSS